MQLSIVSRVTTTGALCLAGTAACSVGFAQFGWWPSAAAALAGTAVFWALGTTLRRQLTQVARAMESIGDDEEELDLSRRLPSSATPELQRIVDAFERHAMRVEEHTATARAIAASLADRALDLSEQIEGNESPNASEVDDYVGPSHATAALMADALVIDRELGTLHGEETDHGFAAIDLPPHPLDWDQCDADARESVQPTGRRGNM